MTETEVKIRWNGSASDARVLIESRGYPLAAERTLESDQLFDRASEELRQSGLVLRLRRSSGISTVTYKGPATREVYKSREEIEFEVSDPEAFLLVLDRLGYHPGFRYEKYRTQFFDPAGAGLVVLDETPIGVFLELEGAEDWIDRTAARLGFAREAYLTASYASLYQVHRAQSPDAGADMTFGLRPLLGTATKQP